MAKIIIELDTEKSDTLTQALLMLDMMPHNLYASAAKDLYDPNAYKSAPGDAELRDAIKTAGETLTDKLKATTVEPAVVLPVATTAAEPLSDMDGDRKRGEAAPGHRRRTNAQIDSDREWMAQKAKAALEAMDKGVHDERPPALRAPHDHLLNVSTGDERINPEDEADEAAETAARKSDKLTLEDLRAAVARYIEKFGHAVSVKNMRTIIGCPVADVPEAELANAIAKVELAISGSQVMTPTNPATGKPSAAAPEETLFGGASEPEAPVTATAAEVVEAIKTYGRKFDGTDVPDNMAFAKEDLPKVFQATFGAKVTGLGSLPDKKPETLGRILVAIEGATEQNTFGRTAK